MISLFETIIEIISVPLENWDDLGLRYKIILFVLLIISIGAILVSLN